MTKIQAVAGPLLWVAMMAACSTENTPAPVPPTIVSVYAEISGGLSQTLDLSSQAQERILPFAHTATFSVLASGASEPADALDATLVDAAGATCPDVSASFSSGLWYLQCVISVGESWQVRLRGSDGGQAQSHGLAIKDYPSAWQGDFRQPLYAADGTFLGAASLVVTAQGAWSVADPQGVVSAAGTLDFQGNPHSPAFIWVIRVDADDQDPNTINAAEQYDFYVGPSYASVAPFFRTQAGEGVVGTWSRQHVPQTGGSDAWVAGDAITNTLSFEPSTDVSDGWDGLWTETTIQGESETIIAGEYRVVPNQDYTANVGDFLHRRVIGGDSDGLETYALFALRFDHLLLSPYLRE